MKITATVLLITLIAATHFSQSQKPKTGAKSSAEKSKAVSAKPKPVATPAKKPSEQAEWDKANAIDNAVKRNAALRKFIEVFPRSTRKAAALGSISAAESQLGNEKLAAGDVSGAAELFKAAATDAPTPMPDSLFNETLSKLPANLYFRGFRDEAIEIAKLLEGKAETKPLHLLNIASFYISIENGSEARRVAETAINLDANSAAAHQALGLANRIDFRLEESAAAYARGLELEPDSITARRGLAETKRSLGRADEAVALYREILAKDEANLPARTGLILALFDAENRAEAEAEMTRSLEANPGNVILLAGAAYWYAAHNESTQAVTFAQKAIDADPRFIWSHIALARAFLNQNKPLDAESTLLAARRYGNFPTLEYEIASARLAAGLFRDAGDELAKSFSVKDGVIYAKLGGRVPLESKNFSELVGLERRASIFSPMAADNPDNAGKLAALLEFKQEMSAPDTNEEKATKSGETFMQGDDKMKVHRQLFIASSLLDKNAALPKVIEIAKNATSGLDAGLDVAEPSTAVMAGELYESRAIAATRGEYVSVPQVPRATLMSVLRGRIEEINGWTYYQMNDAAQAVVHLKRAVGVLPVKSAWWRSSIWRLGTALVVNGKDAEALDAYIKFYKSTGPDTVRYKAIEAVYKRVNGNTTGLAERIGPDPSAPAAQAVAPETESVADGKTEIPKTVPVKEESVSTPIAVSESTPEIPAGTATPPAIKAKAEPTNDSSGSESPKLERTPEEATTASATPETSPSGPTEEKKSVETSATPLPEATPEIQKASEEKPRQDSVEDKSATRKELFPPVIINIPVPENVKKAAKVSEPKSEPAPAPTPEVKPCSLVLSIENITLQDGSGDVAVIVRRDGDGDLEGLTATSGSPETISVRREKIEGLSSQALFVVHLADPKPGEYRILFEMPCGRREIAATVK